MSVQPPVLPEQDAVRGDHGEVANLLASKGGKVWKEAEGRLRELQESHLAGCAHGGCAELGTP